jgi:hypothetical protein
MRIRSFLVVLLVGFSALAARHAVSAETMLGADEVKQLISGKTVSAESLSQGSTFQVYFAPDGKAVRNHNGRLEQASWRVNGAAEHCLALKSGEYCAAIRNNGDGTYTRMVDGVAKIVWTRFVDGKTF